MLSQQPKERITNADGVSFQLKEGHNFDGKSWVVPFSFGCSIIDINKPGFVLVAIRCPPIDEKENAV